jgi:hypothetical protein
MKKAIRGRRQGVQKKKPQQSLLSFDVQLSHPHDFFSLRRYTVVPDTCYVLMPFARDLAIVYDTIVEALRDRMSCSRADKRFFLDGIFPRVMEGIASSELIVADLTGRNANVFYELGLAHVRTKNVLLLSQKREDLPFNIAGMNCFVYEKDSKEGLKALKARIRQAAEELQAKRTPPILRDRVSRTLEIVNHLRDRCDKRGRKKFTIRHQAAMSSFSNIGPTGGENTDEAKYLSLLVEERSAMLRCLESGCDVQLILSPFVPTTYTVNRWRAKMEALIGFLESREPYMNRVEVVLAPFGYQNLLFIGEEILFEGHKTAVASGFDLTLIYTNQVTVRSRIAIFDTLFSAVREDNRTRFGVTDSRSIRLAIAAQIRNDPTWAESGLPELRSHETRRRHPPSERT